MVRLIDSNIPPLSGAVPCTLRDFVLSGLGHYDSLYILTGYASARSLRELCRLVRQYRLKHVCVVLGMYYAEGFPESIYNTATEINDEWVRCGIGEIRIAVTSKYHGKIYGFYRSDNLRSVAVGSHNLSALVKDSSNMLQYEVSVMTDEAGFCREIDAHIRKVSAEPMSLNIASVSGIRIVRERNMRLVGVENVYSVSAEKVRSCKNACTSISFEIPLKVPGIPGDFHDYMKSNVNKCYAKGRVNAKTGKISERDWWETEIIVSNDITSGKGYPDADTPFTVITDDGWKFRMHVSGAYRKNLESEGNLKILGYWLKGRLVTAGIVEYVPSPAEDLKRASSLSDDRYEACRGVITYARLIRYGRMSVKLTRTSATETENGISRAIWMLSFLPESP